MRKPKKFTNQVDNSIRKIVAKNGYVYKNGDFRYHNFLILVEDEFNPKLCWETEKFGWFRIDSFPKPLHFGLEKLKPYLIKYRG